MNLINEEKWDAYIKARPNAHILQTTTWGLFKQNHGWYPKYLLTDNAGAQVLFRRLPFGLSFGYIPKGPVGENWEKIIPEAISLCQQENAFVLFCSTTLEIGLVQTQESPVQCIDGCFYWYSNNWHYSNRFLFPR